jgi:isoquinoline 1-oxidoreductase alpha subunit
MMSASALLMKNSKPSDSDIDAAMNGNVCRCGTYLRIRQAVHKAAAIAQSSGRSLTPSATAKADTIAAR